LGSLRTQYIVGHKPITPGRLTPGQRGIVGTARLIAGGSAGNSGGHCVEGGGNRGVGTSVGSGGAARGFFDG